MPKGIPNAKPEADEDVELARLIAEDEAKQAPDPSYALYEGVPAAKKATVSLTRHYRPEGSHEIVGHWLEKVEAKNAQGIVVVIKPAEFIHGEPMPSPLAGVGTASHKLWAGTVVRLPIDEAKAVRRAGIGEFEIDD